MSKTPIQLATLVRRSSLFFISTTIYSTIAYSVTSSWELFKVNDNNATNLTQINISTNPTAITYRLNVTTEILSYGIHKAVYKAKLTTSNGDINLNDETYFMVVPTGLMVFGFENALQSVFYGKLQAFSLEPVKYSVDLDNMVKMSDLSFKFYCKSTFIGDTSDFSTTGLNDLSTAKSTLNNLGQTCFNTTDAYYFDSTQNTLYIKGGSLGYYPNRVYRFFISTNYVITFSQTLYIYIEPNILIKPSVSFG